METKNKNINSEVETITSNSPHSISRNVSSIGLFLIALVGYHLLFWNELFGINIPIFTIFTFGWLYYVEQKSFKKQNVLISASITLLLSLLIVLHGSLLAKFSYICSLIIFLGFVYQPALKSIFTALPSGLFNFPISFIKGFSFIRKSIVIPKKYSAFSRNIKFIVIPTAVLFVFFIIFKFANPIFDSYTNTAMEWVFNKFLVFFSNLSWTWIFFMIFGIFVIAGLSANGHFSMFAKYDNSKSDILLRKRKKISVLSKTRTIGLKDELKTGLLIILLVNLLLVIINVIDINWIWFNFKPTSETKYAQLVHEGTYLLILSILLSMAILFYYFRNNQNFYSKNRWLKNGAYIWIIQNMILIVSVLIRNLRYIEHLGLTYKRIGVIVFLCMTCFGLITLFLKVKKRKSTYFVLKANSWAGYVILFILTCFNWDLIIVHYNLNMPLTNPIDKQYLLSFSDKTLPILYVNKDRFKEIKSEINSYSDENIIDGQDRIDERILKYKLENKNSSETFLSWNYADYQAKKFFE